jgi:pathogenesis-related protein 1
MRTVDYVPTLVDPEVMRGTLLFALAACSNSNAHQDAPIGDVPGGVGEPPELVGITLAHNQVRAMVDTTGVRGGSLPPLQWDPNLAAYAKQWVMMCRDVDAPIGLVDHDPDRSNVAGYAHIGENIYASSGTATGSDAVMLWAGEKASYDYASNACNGVCGHYTQVVWRDTQKVGCAVYSCARLTYPSTIVCDYGPEGNIGGQRPY